LHLARRIDGLASWPTQGWYAKPSQIAESAVKGALREEV
jgi:hypothetical protein